MFSSALTYCAQFVLLGQETDLGRSSLKGKASLGDSTQLTYDPLTIHWCRLQVWIGKPAGDAGEHIFHACVPPADGGSRRCSRLIHLQRNAVLVQKFGLHRPVYPVRGGRCVGLGR